MSNIATLNTEKAPAKKTVFLPGSTSSKLSLSVPYGRTYADMIVRGAPQTDHTVISALGDISKTFPKLAAVTRKVEVLLVSMPGFTMSRKLERWVAEQCLVPIDFHTMLTVSETYPTLVDDWKLKKIRLVSLAHAFVHLNEKRVCTVHYDYTDQPQAISRTVEYEPLKCGWGEEHHFGFVI